MMKEQKRVPKLRFKEFSGEWDVNKLRDISKIYDGTHQTPKYVEKGIPFYSVEHLTSNQFERTKYISEEVFDKENKRVKLERGDILMTRIGSIGVSKYIDWDVCASFYVSLALIKKKKEYESPFLNQFIKSDFFQRELWKKTIHVAFPQKINLGEIGECLVALPSQKEQQKIAAFLSSVDKKITQLQQKLARLEAYKKGVMQQIFSQELRFTRENGSAYPDWEEKRLNKVSNINPKAKKLPNSFYYIDLESVNKGILTRKQRVELKNAPSRAQRLLKKGDILFQTVRPYQKNNLHFNIIDDDFVASTGYAQIRAYESASYVFHFLHTNQFVNRVLSRCTGTSYPTINSSDLGKISIKIPCLEEQTQIAEFLSAIDKKIVVVQTQIEHTQRFKKGLLQQLFV